MEQKVQEKAKRAKPEEIYRRQLERRASAALKQHRAFAQAHQADSREALLAYVRQCAEGLGRTPYPVEVVGSPFLASQFGGWAALLQEAELSPLPGKPVGAVRADLASEIERQAQLHHRAKAEKKAERTAKRKAKQASIPAMPRKKSGAQKRKAGKKALQLEADMAWGQEHETDTDEQLLEYLRRCAETLPKGQTLRKEQVLGGYYIAKRFGKWPVALFLAGVPLPEECGVSREDLETYEHRRGKWESAKPIEV